MLIVTIVLNLLACHACWNTKIQSTLSVESSKVVFMEVIKLMKDYGVDLDTSSIKYLLRFLVKTESDAPATTRILKKLYIEEDRFEIGFVENALMTVVLLKHSLERPSWFIKHMVQTSSTGRYLSVPIKVMDEV